jgi:hypothetical protein
MAKHNFFETDKNSTNSTQDFKNNTISTNSRRAGTEDRTQTLDKTLQTTTNPTNTNRIITSPEFLLKFLRQCFNGRFEFYIITFGAGVVDLTNLSHSTALKPFLV